MLFCRRREKKMDNSNLVSKEHGRQENGYVNRAAFMKDTDIRFKANANNGQTIIPPPNVNVNGGPGHKDVAKPAVNGDAFYSYKKQNLSPVWGISNLKNTDSTTQTDVDSVKRKNEKNEKNATQDKKKQKDQVDAKRESKVEPKVESKVIPKQDHKIEPAQFIEEPIPVVVNAWPNNEDVQVTVLNPSTQKKPQGEPNQSGFIGDLIDVEYIDPREDTANDEPNNYYSDSVHTQSDDVSSIVIPNNVNSNTQNNDVEVSPHFDYPPNHNNFEVSSSIANLSTNPPSDSASLNHANPHSYEVSSSIANLSTNPPSVSDIYEVEIASASSDDDSYDTQL